MYGMNNIKNGMLAHVACMGGFRNYVICRSEKLNRREKSSLALIHNSMEKFSWGA
jgi:hypothetical protein